MNLAPADRGRGVSLTEFDDTMSAMEFTLKFPITRDGQTITTMKGRRPTVRDMQSFMKDVDADQIMAVQKVLSSIFQVQTAVIGDLDIEDYAPMQKAFMDFLEPMKTVFATEA